MRAPVRTAATVLSVIGLAVAALGGAARPVAAGIDTTVKITVTLTGNGQGYWRTDDGFINCVRSGGITSGSCSHEYDIPGDPIPYGFVYASDPGSCWVQGENCNEGGQGPSGYLAPGPDQFPSMEFRLLDPTLITVKKSGTGSGTVKSTPRGIDCGSDCKSDFGNGSTFSLKATAKSGSKFTKWTGGPCDGQGSTCSFTVGASNATVTAVFTKIVTATPTPEITEPPATPEPAITPEPTEAPVPTPFPTEITTPTSAGTPAPTGPPTSPTSDEGGRSTLVLVLGSLLVVLLAAGGLVALRSRRPAPPPPAS